MRMFGWGEGNNAKESCEQHRGSSLSGYLWKMKREKKTVVPQWSKRWFSIEGRNLKWYRASNSEAASGSIDLRNITGAFRFEAGGKGVFSFAVYCSERSLLLRASNVAEMKMWLRAIQMQADLANGGNGTGILCKSNQADGVRSQKKLRSHTLQSELNRKMMELDNLERSINFSEEKGSFQEEDIIRHRLQNEADNNLYRGDINGDIENMLYRSNNQPSVKIPTNDNLLLTSSTNNNNNRSNSNEYHRLEEKQQLLDQNRKNSNNNNSRYSSYAVDEKEAPRSSNSNNNYPHHMKTDYQHAPDDEEEKDEDSGYRIRKPNSKTSSRRYGSRESDSQFSEPKLSICSIDKSQSKSSRNAWL